LVEALEDPRAERFALAVQWHPEIAWERDAFSKALFARFIRAAREYAALCAPPLSAEAKRA
jgi:gamma-glutamyl-gamma-aminobutyrate hydrolase PuuD